MNIVFGLVLVFNKIIFTNPLKLVYCLILVWSYK